MVAFHDYGVLRIRDHRAMPYCLHVDPPLGIATGLRIVVTLIFACSSEILRNNDDQCENAYPFADCLILVMLTRLPMAPKKPAEPETLVPVIYAD